MQKNNKKVAFDALMPLILEKLNANGVVKIPAMGISMYPLFQHKRDQVFLEKVDEETIKKYDMILYKRENGQYVLHRIVGVDEKGYFLRGDNQLYDEYPVISSQVIAKVTGFQRKEKQVSCDNFWYRWYAVCWVHTLMVRKCYVKIIDILMRLKNKIVRKKVFRR